MLFPMVQEATPATPLAETPVADVMATPAPAAAAAVAAAPFSILGATQEAINGRAGVFACGSNASGRGWEVVMVCLGGVETQRH